MTARRHRILLSTQTPGELQTRLLLISGDYLKIAGHYPLFPYQRAIFRYFSNLDSSPPGFTLFYPKISDSPHCQRATNHETSTNRRVSCRARRFAGPIQDSARPNSESRNDDKSLTGAESFL